jgi:hypothetical protein
VCDVCTRIIEPGETYTRGVGLDGGAGAWTYRYCAHCAALTAYLADLFGLSEYEPTYLVEDWEPAGDAQHAVKAAHAARWRTGPGGLLPVPVILHEDPAAAWRATGIAFPEPAAA